MPSPSKAIWCRRDMIQFPLYYAYIPDEKSWDREMKRLGIQHEPYPKKPGRTTFLIEDTGKRIALVTIDQEEAAKHPTAEVAALVAHEAMHVWQDVMEIIGEDSPSKEFGAYAFQTIFHELYSAYLETKE